MKIVVLSFAFFLIPSQVGAASSGREVNNDWLDGRRLHELSELEVDKLLVEKRAVGSLADRAVFFARMGIDQPVGLYVTGEFPFELIDEVLKRSSTFELTPKHGKNVEIFDTSHYIFSSLVY